MRILRSLRPGDLFRIPGGDDHVLVDQSVLREHFHTELDEGKRYGVSEKGEIRSFNPDEWVNFPPPDKIPNINLLPTGGHTELHIHIGRFVDAEFGYVLRLVDSAVVVWGTIDGIKDEEAGSLRIGLGDIDEIVAGLQAAKAMAEAKRNKSQ